jgi:hypothetical protein
MTMGKSKKEEKDGIKCPACGSSHTSVVKGSKVILAYPGFYSGTSSDKYTRDNNSLYCKDCKTEFQVG